MDCIKTEFTLTLYENPKNKEKSSVMGALEIMFDDEDNALPSAFLTLNGDAGTDVPWGIQYKITIEEL